MFLPLVVPNDYTLERDNRELQRYGFYTYRFSNYTLERDNRELQRFKTIRMAFYYYTLERDNRELQRMPLVYPPLEIIPLREIIGNYNL